MKIKRIESEVFILDVPEHNQYKDELLKLIDEMPDNSFDGVSKSDWSLPKTLERKYLKLFYDEVIVSSMLKLKDYFKADAWRIENGWFQQYHKNSYHQWHNHININWANSYFLELPDPKFRTQIKIKNKILKYDVKEGQLLCFPAHLLHRSKPNGKKRKTVIAFNSNFTFGL
tara:strand:- start:472 stop:987 length:516 start_codon:yes stop_codon:yes gene_type:complete